MSETVVLLSF